MDTRIVLCLALVACGSAPSPSAPPPASKGADQAVLATRSIPVDPALTAAADSLVREAGAALDRCASVVIPAIDAARPPPASPAVEPSLTPDALRAACDPVTALHDRYDPVLRAHLRSSNQLLDALARVSEDARIYDVQTALTPHGTPYWQAVEHLHSALIDAPKVLAEVAKVPNDLDMQLFPDRTATRETFTTDLRRMVVNDGNDLGGAAALFDAFAWDQRDGIQQGLVRTRQLLHFGHWYETLASSHRAELRALTVADPALQARKDTLEAYVAACEALSATFLAASAPFLDGTLARADADVRRAEVGRAFAAWKAAHAQALAATAD